jgi:hypothetical protein
LAQHLIDADVVRHQAGAWSLPTTLDEVALPCDMEQAQLRVVDPLSQDCRLLAATSRGSARSVTTPSALRWC